MAARVRGNPLRLHTSMPYKHSRCSSSTRTKMADDGSGGPVPTQDNGDVVSIHILQH